MILVKTFECIVAPIADKASTAMQCTGEIVAAVSPWDVFTTYANWGILVVAAIALGVSEKSRRDSRKAMKDTLDASNTALQAQLKASAESRESSDKATEIQLAASREALATNERAIETQIRLSQEALDANHNATQAQLDASREATRADLKERKNARELETTASFIAALDEMMMDSSRSADEEGRGVAIRDATRNALLAAGRYQLIVGDSREITLYQEQFLRLLEGFAPTSMDDFETIQYERLTRVHAVLRTGIIEFQNSRTLPPIFAHIRANLKLGNLEILDQILGIDLTKHHFPNTND